MHMPSVFGPFGLLLPALLAWSLFVWDWGWVLYPTGPRRMRILGGLVAALASCVALLQVLFYVGWLRPVIMLTVAAVAIVGLRYVRHSRRHAENSPREFDFGELVPALPLVFLTFVGVSLASLAAYWLPIWQWDSLGYHLPFVNFALQGGGIAGLPIDVPYLSTYPRNVELLFVAWRVTLPDDRLVDAAQLPFGLVAAGAVAGIARELGAVRVAAVVAGCAFVVLPAVYLQLPTNYIDVASAAFFLLACFFVVAPPNSRSVILAGLALGLYLGAKPSAPPAAALLAVTLLLRAHRAGHLKAALVGVLGAGALGSEAYLLQLVRHGNPVWPAVVKLGPFELPGTVSVDQLLSSGAGAEKVTGSLGYRVLASWSSLNSLPTFDMRVGGLGLTFWAALPFAILHLVRRKAWLWVVVIGASLTTPDPAVARYVLPFPGLLLALAAAEWSHGLEHWAFVGNRRRTPIAATVIGAVFGLGVHQLWYAFPGLSGEGPPLFDYAAMSWAERERAVGANGEPTAFVDARQGLAKGDVAAYDAAFWLPYLMWRSDAANRVIRISDAASSEQVNTLLDLAELRLIAVGHDQPAHAAVKNRTDYEPLFECPEPCTVYRRD